MLRPCEVIVVELIVVDLNIVVLDILKLSRSPQGAAHDLVGCQ